METELLNVRVAFTIRGECASKANSRRLVKFGNRPASIKSAKALNYEATARAQIPASAMLMLATPLRFTATIYYASQRPDLDESVLLDVLQAKFKGEGKNRMTIRRGVYENDRLVREKHIFWGLDKQNPRAEILIETLDGMPGARIVVKRMSTGVTNV